MKLTTQIPIPKGVSDAAWKGLNLSQDFGRGGTRVGMRMATLLAYRPSVSLVKVLHIAKYFPRHAGDKLDQKNPPSNGYIAWLLWGGDPGRRWAERIKRQWEWENNG